MNLPKSSKDIKLGKFLELKKVVDAIPLDYKEFLSETDNKKADRLHNKIDPVDLLNWQAACLGCITGKPDNEIASMKMEEVSEAYGQIYKFIVSILYHTPIGEDIKPSSQFKFKDQLYKAPASGKDYLGNDEPLKEMAFGEFVEALEIRRAGEEMENGNWQGIPLQLAILYKKPKEVYNEKMVKERAKLFLDLPMDIVWGCTFFLMLRRITSLTDSSLKASQTRMQKELA